MRQTIILNFSNYREKVGNLFWGNDQSEKRSEIKPPLRWLEDAAQALHWKKLNERNIHIVSIKLEIQHNRMAVAISSST